MAYKASEKASVEKPVVKFAKDNGVDVLKINPMWAASWPDRLFFVPGGKPLLIEFKRPGGKLTERQAHKIEELRSAGYDVHVIDSKEEGKALVRARLEAYRVHEAGNQVGPGAPRKRTVSRPRAAKD